MLFIRKLAAWVLPPVFSLLFLIFVVPAYFHMEAWVLHLGCQPGLLGLWYWALSGARLFSLGGHLSIVTVICLVSVGFARVVLAVGPMEARRTALLQHRTGKESIQEMDYAFAASGLTNQLRQPTLHVYGASNLSLSACRFCHRFIP